MFRSKKNLKNKNDQQLLLDYLADGDLDVLGELFGRYMHLVYGVALKYLKNRDEAKDAVTQIFERLITEIPKFEILNFKSWLFVVTKNYCLMEIRREKANKNRFEKFSADQNMESTELLHPIDEDLNSSLQENLKHCLDRLKKEQQECVQLFYYQEKSYGDIADELNIAEKKVKSYIQNGKRNLKICLEQLEKEHEV
ncbi:sigma-70 family RNA polymerase sigma factor [Labilibaculum sp. DW002]|uniref:Sigma-70 family RNA polymerase sigma factor n=1 Tax=Paralabilibaculum antarcticum TaxID=2912572 RepID=A0ABT5VTE9_9BACT|nr:sigma-70 family RNA polymerase sigma factor [Labilibaculum sp. DW002]MDE5418700.1 sigma-70 family RNA polymerase sigma factor [Labilibaculum sp. DW002]